MELVLTSSYPPPINQLLTYGETEVHEPDKWPNYLELGLGPEHIPDLIRMVADEELRMRKHSLRSLTSQAIKARQHARRKPRARWLNSLARNIVNSSRIINAAISTGNINRTF